MLFQGGEQITVNFSPLENRENVNVVPGRESCARASDRYTTTLKSKQRPLKLFSVWRRLSRQEKAGVDSQTQVPPQASYYHYFAATCLRLVLVRCSILFILQPIRSIRNILGK